MFILMISKNLIKIYILSITIMCLFQYLHSFNSRINHRSFSKKVISMKSTKSETINESGIVKMDEIVNLCKRRGFIFQSSEIYNAMAGFFDYGPLGVELKNNIKKLWWRDHVQRRDDIVGLDSSIISSSSIWKASGHVAGFSDPMVDCKVTRLRYRADQVFWGKLETDAGNEVCYVSVLESEVMLEEATKAALKIAKKAGISGPFKPIELKDLTEASTDIYDKIPSPATGEPGQLTPPRDFNLMFKTDVGALSDDSSIAYLRPETAQGIFTNFLNVQRTARKKVPFGIAQIGKAFRNEITPRNYIFRSREFEQMEIEYFIPPDDDIWEKYHNEWIDTAWNWLLSIGLKSEYMYKCVHAKDKLAHYARACTDITFNFPFGISELMGIAARGNYDLTQHSNASGKLLEYFDPVTNIKYIPHVIEPSIGVDRLFLALLVSSYNEEVIDNETRVVLKFQPSIAPIKAAVLPLVNNKPEISEKALELYNIIKKQYNCEYDTSGAIGRRYRRADEIGIPFCLTIDFDSLVDNTVTLRDRDTMKQIRIPINEVMSYITKQIET
uniref:glycine--tRNA ligase n=1 Tax=Chromulina nebulosa TaxID=96789 RepID=A0A7S0SY82_9STRA|mmetsp:Transcript_3755/g.3363  ORF Transcript_3755/g.3363 Transcript_3755/m.3363 type:complete len:556 (+) Transcript_3755:28-1695(+)